jgi:hypothetical protein
LLKNGQINGFQRAAFADSARATRKLQLEGVNPWLGEYRSVVKREMRRCAIRWLPADAECVSDTVDVVAPGGNQSDLQYGLIVKSFAAQPFVILRSDSCRIFCELHDVWSMMRH